MPHIQVLDQVTIDKIAAGEVVERPASVVKELVENAIDAGATSVTTEIRDGGISLIRIMDNGCGIEHEEVRRAFLRHSTSKIKSVEDISHIHSLGFRGEALSSIAAVTQTELITKTRDAELGTRYIIEGGKETLIEEIGAPDGTTFLVRQLFYNVPARRKFLKTSATEAGHIQELLIHLSLSHPEVAFLFISNGQEKLRTSGSGKLKEVIYQVYGRDVAANLLEIDYEKGGLRISGYLGKPVITRGNRNYENFFVNGRYVKSPMLSKSLEDAYRDFTMQHKFPFAVLHFQIDGEEIDVNVHPTKMELRFQKQQEIYNTVFEGVQRRLLEPELIQKADVPEPVGEKHLGNEEKKEKSPFLLKPEKKPEESEQERKTEIHDEEYFIKKMRERVEAYHKRSSSAEVNSRRELFRPDIQKDRVRETVRCAQDTAVVDPPPEEQPAEQLDLFEEKFLKRDVRAEYKLIGQIFDTYWLVEYRDNMYIIDQHAAHERVLYERTLKNMKTRTFSAQYLSPPIILSLTMQEAEMLNENMERFKRIGFEIEPFGGEEYAVRAIPDNMFSIAKKELLMEMIDEMADGINTSMTPELVDEKIASMSCKAAVKGNSRMSVREAEALIGELLTLENPYHCPHGRPTIIAMTKKELEKKFKRIV